MSFRKIKADKIFDGYSYRNDKVLVINDNGMVEDLIDFRHAGDMEEYNGILAPGLINCHCHLELSHMKGRIPEGTGLVDFVLKLVSERHYPEEEIIDAISKAENEMLQNGIVAVGDICNNPTTLYQKQKGRLHYYNFIEASGWLPSVSENRIQSSKKLFELFLHLPGEKGLSIVPHAPYSVSKNLWQQIRPFFENKTVTIHNQETACEDEFFLKASGDFIRMYELMKIDNSHYIPTGKSSLQSFFENLAGASKIILVHNTFTKKEDIDYIKLVNQSGSVNWDDTFFCLCPNANMYIEQKLPPLDLLREQKCSIVLGTDSLASNHALDIMEEIRTVCKYFPSIPLEEMLKWVTINGARALDMDDMLGSFEKGKRPGVVLINGDQMQAVRLI